LLLHDLFVTPHYLLLQVGNNLYVHTYQTFNYCYCCAGNHLPVHRLVHYWW